MEFHQLRYFVAAAETGSMTCAAQRVHVSQPALSRQVALLEDELGVQLFERVRKRIHLTDAGRFFLAKSRQLLCDAEMGAQQVREQYGGVRRTLRLGFIAPFADDLVTPAVREFRQRHPKSLVSLFDLPPRAQLDRLRVGELDAAILGNIDDDERTHFLTQELSRHRFVAVLPEQSKLAHRKSVKLADLKNENWVSLANAFFPGRREFLLAACRKAGFEPKIVAEVDSLQLMLTAIGTGNEVGIMPGHAAKLPHAGCALVPLIAPVVSSPLLLLRPKTEPSPELAALIALIQEGATRLSGK